MWQGVKCQRGDVESVFYTPAHLGDEDVDVVFVSVRLEQRLWFQKTLFIQADVKMFETHDHHILLMELK